LVLYWERPIRRSWRRGKIRSTRFLTNKYHCELRWEVAYRCLPFFLRADDSFSPGLTQWEVGGTAVQTPSANSFKEKEDS
jgi:hypothetical protein